MNKFVTFVALLVSTSIALPAAASSTKGVITEIRRTASQVQVYLDVESGTSCSGNPFYYNEGSTSEKEDWFRMINSAFLAGLTVWFTLNNNTDCRITAVRVHR